MKGSSTGDSSSTWIVAIVAGVVFVGGLTLLLDHPAIRNREQRASSPAPTPPPAPSDRASPRGQPIVLPDDANELTPLEREGVDWMAVPEMPSPGAMPRVKYADGTPVDRANRDDVLRSRGLVGSNESNARSSEPADDWDVAPATDEEGSPAPEPMPGSPYMDEHTPRGGPFDRSPTE